METKNLNRLAISDNGFIFDPSTGISYNCNLMALTIINLLKAGLSEEEIETKIYSEFEVTQENLNRDVAYFVNQLKNLHLVK